MMLKTKRKKSQFLKRLVVVLARIFRYAIKNLNLKRIANFAAVIREQKAKIQTQMKIKEILMKK